MKKWKTYGSAIVFMVLVAMLQTSAIGEASFVLPVSKKVPAAQSGGIIGKDDRQKIDLRKQPYGSIVYVYVGSKLKGKGDYASACSGTVIAKDKVLTSAVCLENINTQKTFTKGVVVPGYNNGGGYGLYNIKTYYVTGYWHRYAFYPENFAVLKIEKYKGKNIGDVVKPLSIKKAGKMKGTIVKNAGYSTTREKDPGQWGMQGKILNETVDELMMNIDVELSQIGSPILNRSNEINGIVVGYTYNSTMSLGLKVNDQMESFVKSVIKK
ncbi:glutamyl endopeptidase [Fictibacillus macauensis ZFHKF-1]|uniref:Glutamyl endopeptidase n=1 Tax=Fictibacillus macauensis ZFHKF-1 TaxID=1196324 RepID=I8UC30_9BACL|nr:trypsin-like serine protease [Fictibacillus macauensis]EIT84353.1 glutamyl endopeptidase [Fictibacillus macauensis ZFHKF-1]